MSYHYIYATNGTTTRPGPSIVGAKELTAAQAEKAFRMPVGSPSLRARFAVIRVDEATGRHVAFMEMAAGANGVELKVVNEYKSIEFFYGWRAYFVPHFTETKPVYQGNADSIFLAAVAKYTYPDEPRRFGQSEADMVHATYYYENGEAQVHIDEAVGPHRIIQTETTKHTGVDVSSNYFKIPEFGQWDAFFNVHEPFAQEYAQKMNHHDQ